MRLDINISAGMPPGDDGSATRAAAQIAGQMGHLLSRMEFDYPTQMLAVVKVDNDDGTYDCHRPGTSIYMSRVETISPVLAQRISVGMTVLIRFFRRDRNKPYIVRVAGGIAPASALGWFNTWATPGQERDSGDTSGPSSLTAPTWNGWAYAGGSLRVFEGNAYYLGGSPTTDPADSVWAILQAGDDEWSHGVYAGFLDHAGQIPYQLDFEDGAAYVAWGTI